MLRDKGLSERAAGIARGKGGGGRVGGKGGGEGGLPERGKGKKNERPADMDDNRK